VRKKPNKDGDEPDDPKSRPKKPQDDEEISSESDEERFEQNGTQPEQSSDEEEAETAQEKRIRLAKKYLEEIERQGKVFILHSVNFFFRLELMALSVCYLC
jgi:ribosomal RNA-processing protein 9